MKKLWILCLALIMALSLVSCDDQDPTTDTSADTTVDTSVETTAETTIETNAETDEMTIPLDTLPSDTEPQETLDGEYLLDKVLAAENDLIPENADYAMNFSMTMDMVTNTNGMNANVSITVGMDYIVDADGGIQLSLQVPGSERTRLIYVGDKLYVDMDEEKYVSSITPEDFSTLLSEIVASSGMDMNMGDGTSGGMDADKTMALLESMLAMVKPSALFGDAVATTNEDGNYVITAMGISEQAKKIFDTLMAQSGEGDENGEMSSTMLEEMFSLSDMTLTFIADKDYVLTSVSVSFPIDMGVILGYEQDSEMMGKITLHLSVDRDAQTVVVPKNADRYTELDWRWIFDMPTAEMLRLVPDENNQITLVSDDLTFFDYQYYYILEHPEEFDGVTFTWTGLFDGIETYHLSDFWEDVSQDEAFTVLSVYIAEGDDEEFWTSNVWFALTEDMASNLTFETETPVTVTFVLANGENAETLYELGIFFDLISCTSAEVQ